MATIERWFQKTCVQDAKSLDEHISKLSAWYDAHDTVVNKETLRLWGILSDLSKQHAQRLCAKHKVTVTETTGQPYDSETAMFHDIKQGCLLISTDNVDHPIMTLQETVQGRIWHDLTHYEEQTNFSFQGETDTYFGQVNQVKQYNPQFLDVAKHTLYLDIVCQLASGKIYQKFPEQKVFEARGETL